MKKMLDDGDVDAIVCEHPTAQYLVANDCDFAVTGGIFA